MIRSPLFSGMNRGGLSSVFLAVVGILYLSLVFLGISRHEPWFDELQAWLLARDSTLGELIFHQLQYEGHPGLWYFLLMIPAKMGINPFALNVISGIVGSFTAFLILLKSPFPQPVKYLLPFGFFFLYQYSIVARSYSLFVFLFFTFIHLESTSASSRRWATPLLVTLMCSTILHAFLILPAFLYYFYPPDKESRLKIQWPWIVYGISALFWITVLWTPSDASTPAKFWKYNPLGINLLLQTFHSNNLFAAAILLLSSFTLFKKKLLTIFLAPCIALLLFATFKYANIWHEGLFFIVWLGSFWIHESTSAPSTSLTFSRALLLMVALIQMIWGITSWNADRNQIYSPTQEVADVLNLPDNQTKTISVLNERCYGVQAYFKSNRFINYPTEKHPLYYPWSLQRDPLRDLTSIPRFNPDLILDCTLGNQPPQIIEDYLLIQSFTGNMLWKNDSLTLEVFRIYKRL